MIPIARLLETLLRRGDWRTSQQPYQGNGQFRDYGLARTGASVAGGVLQLKHPSERRPGLPPDRAVVFWLRFLWETLSKHADIIAMIARLLFLKFIITRDRTAKAYTDIALTHANDEEAETLGLLTQTTGRPLQSPTLRKSLS